MRVLVSPDCFTGTLTSVEAANAIRDGWLQVHPDDDVVIAPLSDGGPGFVGGLHAVLGGELITSIVTGPLGKKTPAQFLLRGKEAWIESAQACGLHLIEQGNRDPRVTSTFGVGELIIQAIDRGAETITIGLGGSGTNDAGAGMLAALGATADGALDNGGAALKELSNVELSAALEKVSEVELIAASDVDNTLLGLRGATAVFGPQKGADEFAVMELEGALENFATLCGRRADGKDPAVALGAGAAGGLGYGLLLLGANRVAGIETVLEIVKLDDEINSADLVITGEGCLDDQSLHGKVIAGVASHAAALGKPCVALAGEVRLGKRECATAGIDSAYSMTEFAGRERSMASPAEVLAEVSARMSQTWGRR
ncbi:MAG: glycerate kinase [Candidatus Nanopelagicales bacterium]|nr:glycerate kinase [Candidatus Nanopelagicales bacterium]